MRPIHEGDVKESWCSHLKNTEVARYIAGIALLSGSETVAGCRPSGVVVCMVAARDGCGGGVFVFR